MQYHTIPKNGTQYNTMSHSVMNVNYYISQELGQ